MKRLSKESRKLIKQLQACMGDATAAKAASGHLLQPPVHLAWASSFSQK
jgi:hypothetical protein